MTSLFFFLFFVTVEASEVVSDGGQEAVSVAPSGSISGTELMESWVRRMGAKTHPRGLVQIPVLSVDGQKGICGSFHYNPDRYWNNERYGFPNRNTRSGPHSGRTVDNYMEKNAACSLASVIQEWHKTHCPNPAESGCRLAYGDSGHEHETNYVKPVQITRRTRADIWSHSTHTNGKCVDIRPMRTGAFKARPLSPPDEDYDREKTKELLLLLQKHGGFGGVKPNGQRLSNILFSDPEIKAQAPGLNVQEAKGHHNHIHVCFEDKQACEKLSYDLPFCRGLEGRN